MTTGETLYLALVLAAFASFMAVLAYYDHAQRRAQEGRPAPTSDQPVETVRDARRAA